MLQIIRGDESLDLKNPLIACHKPGLTDLLRAIGLDVAYERAAGDSLYYRNRHGSEIEVLDLVGGYGTLLWGHNHPKLIAAATEFFSSGRVNHVQGSIRQGAQRLARALNRRLRGHYCTVLANSGTEAVEAALKHALLETQAGTFIALEGGFHGKTLGALGVTSNAQFREPFGRSNVNVVRVRPNDVRELKAAFERTDDLAGFLFEPIQGEAGVRPLTAEFVRLANEFCLERNVPLIADECQTGLARTGTFLASESLGIAPDYIILSKSLGGGLAKISALLIDRKRYRPEFDLIHSSTFADDEFSCAMALKVLELTGADAMARCRRKGDYLLSQLRALQQQYPGVIAEVRGAGLMIGLELRHPDEHAGLVLNHLADRKLLGLFVASFLLNEHRIRVAPTLSDPLTLRLQPSLLIQKAQMERVVAAFADACGKITEKDVVGLTRVLAEPKPVIGTAPALFTSDTPLYFYRGNRSSNQACDDASTATASRSRVAWVFHLIDDSDLVHLDPALSALTATEKSAFSDRWSAMAEPLVMNEVDIRSTTGEMVRLQPILLPVTSAWMLKKSRGRGISRARALVQKAVDVAATLHCDVVSLGQFTSIVTRRGMSLQCHGVHITAGSDYTAAIAAQAIGAELQRRVLNSTQLTLAVVGAAGDIGRTCAGLMAADFRQCILVGSGRVGSRDRLERVADDIPGAKVSTSLDAIAQANVVVCATNCTSATIGPECLHGQAIVCDVSVPTMLQPRIAEILPNVTIVPGGMVALPFGERFDIPGFPLPPGFTYGCMAEGLLLGLDGRARPQWLGRSSPQQALELGRIAARHGFGLAARCDPHPAEVIP